MKCAVINCDNSNEGKASTTSFFSFPSNPTLKKQWVQFCGRNDKFNPSTAYICMEHFKLDDYENNMQYEMGFAIRRLLKHGAVPTINIAAIKNKELYKEREIRKEKRENKKLVALLLKEYKADVDPIEEKMCEPVIPMEEGEDPLNENILPNLNIEEDCLKTLRAELDALRTENRALKRAYTAELKAKEEKIAKITKIYEYNLDELNKRLIKANSELTNLEENLNGVLTKDQIEKLKLTPFDM